MECLQHWIPLQKRESSPLSEPAWFMLRDMLHSDISLRYRPQEVAIAIIYLIAVCYGVHIPCDPTKSNEENKYWWSVSEVTFVLIRIVSYIVFTKTKIKTYKGP